MEGTPRYLTPPPQPGQDGGEVPQGTYPPPQPGYLPPSQVTTVGRGTQNTYAPAKVSIPPPDQVRGEGYPKVPTLPQAKVGTPSPRIGQHMEYLIHCGQYASCIHAGELSCGKSFWTLFRVTLDLKLVIIHYSRLREGNQDNSMEKPSTAYFSIDSLF